MYRIRTENLGKQYVIGGAEIHTKTFREAVMETALSPMRKLRRLSGGHSDLNTFWALKGLSVAIEDGQIVGVVGRNGAGKSTLLKLLSRITVPSEGRIRIRGRVASLLEVGTGFHPELTGRENIFLNGAIMGMKRAEIKRKFDEIVDFAGIETFINTPVKRYSSGMYVRLAFGVAAHVDPDVLLVDEILAVGDAEFQKKCLGKMSHAAVEGRTVVFVSHNLGAIKSLCSHGLFLHAGRLRCIGNIETVLREYSRFDADLADGRWIAAEAARVHNTDAIKPDQLWVEIDGNEVFYDIPAGSAFTIKFQFTVKKPLKACSAAVGLVTFDGIPLSTFRSAAEALNPGRYEMTAVVDHAFQQNKITLTIGVVERSLSIYYAESVKSIQIGPDSSMSNANTYRAEADLLMQNTPAVVCQIGN